MNNFFIIEENQNFLCFIFRIFIRNFFLQKELAKTQYFNRKFNSSSFEECSKQIFAKAKQFFLFLRRVFPIGDENLLRICSSNVLHSARLLMPVFKDPKIFQTARLKNHFGIFLQA